MDQKEFTKKFIKFLAVSQVVGLFYVIKLEAWNAYFVFSFLLPLITGGILLYFFFKGIKMTVKYYVLGFMLYFFMGILFFIPAYLGVEFFYSFIIWNFLYGIYLILVIVGRKILPGITRYSIKQIGAVDWKSRIQNLKKITFRQAGTIVLILLVLFVSISIWSGSRKKDRCRKLHELAEDYREMIEENRHLADKYENDGERIRNRNGNFTKSYQGVLNAALLMNHYNSKVNRYEEKLKDMQNEMVELGCNR